MGIQYRRVVEAIAVLEYVRDNRPRKFNMEAGAVYFGITYETAVMLFSPRFYSRAHGRRAVKAVIARLQCLLDAPTPKLGELAVADAAIHTGANKRLVECKIY